MNFKSVWNALIKKGHMKIKEPIQHSIKKWIKRGVIFILAFLTLICTLLAFTFMFSFSNETYMLRKFPKNFTDPLTLETVDHLCFLLELGEDDVRCTKYEIYAYEFFPQIRERYPKMTPREQVDAELGRFLISCSEPNETISDGVFQRCEYDLQGDGAYTISVNYRVDTMDLDEISWLAWSICTYNMQNASSPISLACNPPKD